MLSDKTAQAHNIELPPEFITYRELGGGNIPPWDFLDDESFVLLKKVLDRKYPAHKECIPFAQNLASDDIALFTTEGDVRSLHLNASPGWESPTGAVPFTAWMREVFAQCPPYLQSVSITPSG